MRGRGGGEGVRTRDHLANTRTTLSIAHAGIGLLAAALPVDRLGYRDQAISCAVIGLVTVGYSFARHMVQRARIESEDLRQVSALDVALVVVAGVVAMAGLVWLGSAR